MLTAPDMDADTFVQVANGVRTAAQRVTLYASSNDSALRASAAYQGGWRAGDTAGGVLVLEDIDTVDVSVIDTDLLGTRITAIIGQS